MSIELIPVILCGGAGSRLWPMSRRLLPKQFLPLISEHSMLQETAMRAMRLDGARAPVVVCSEEHRFLVAEQMRAIGATPQLIILEPLARNTAPALTAAALAVAQSNPGAVMLVLPADHLIRDEAALGRAVDAAAKAAGAGALATFGIVPDRPETGYGYIELEDATPSGDCLPIKRFVEKPDRDTAEQFVASGRFLWNSGMFALQAETYLAELRRLRPDILAAVNAAWDGRTRDLDFCRLEATSFGACPADSIDYAVMEHTTKAVVVPANIGWSDIGSWTALWETGDKDAHNNLVRGDVTVHDTRNSYLRAESRLLSVLGVDNLVVVETSDAVLVMRKDLAQGVKDVVSQLDRENRTEHLSHLRVYRPWGYYENIDAGDGFLVKRLMVKPGEALSLQLHRRRTEHWVVVSGSAQVTVGDKVLTLVRNESTYIPLETKHRLANPGADPLFLIEVQSGDYLGEDDIVRFEDKYRRS